MSADTISPSVLPASTKSDAPAEITFDWESCAEPAANGLKVNTRVPAGFNSRKTHHLKDVIPGIKGWAFGKRKNNCVYAKYATSSGYEDKIRFHLNGFGNPLKSINGTIPYVPAAGQSGGNFAKKNEEEGSPNRPNLDLLIPASSDPEQFAMEVDKRTLEFGWAERDDWYPDTTFSNQAEMKFVYRPMLKAPKPSKDKTKDRSNYRNMLRVQVSYEGDNATEISECTGINPETGKWQLRPVTTVEAKKRLCERKWNSYVIDCQYNGLYFLSPNMGHRVAAIRLCVMVESAQEKEKLDGDYEWVTENPADAQPVHVASVADSMTVPPIGVCDTGVTSGECSSETAEEPAPKRQKTQ